MLWWHRFNPAFCTGIPKEPYFHLADQTEIGDDYAAWRDLVVDILVTPDDHCQVLDEEEVPAEVGPAVWERIEQARLEILGSQKRLVEEIENATRRL